MSAHRPLMHRLALVLLGLALSACGTGVGSSSSDLTNGLGGALSEFLVVDLSTGAVTELAAVPDLLTNPAYRTTRMVFRRIASGTVGFGSAPGVRWAQGDETPRRQSVPSCFLGVFEVTRAQWQALGGGDPVAAITPASLAGTPAADIPACGLSLTAIRATLRLWHHGGRFAVPTAAQWEYACRAGSTGLFSWGDATDAATVQRYAVTAQVATPSGPLPVGGRDPNSWGFYDMHGNVWEWNADGNLRGGSWNDGLPLARSANHLVVDTATAHALAGLRLIYAR